MKKIVVLSRNPNLYSTRRIVEAGSERGHEMMVLDHLKCNLLMEKNKPQVYHKGQKVDNVHAVIPRIGASVTFYGTAVVRHFEMMKVFSTIESGAILRSRDKLRSLQVLSRAGLGLPKTAFANFTSDPEVLIESVGGTPVIIKLLEGTQGLGVVLAETMKSASSVIEAFNGLRERVIIQEFIKEAKGADIRVFVINGKVVGAMKRQGKEGEFRSNLHRGGKAEVVTLSKKESNAAIKAAHAMGLAVAGVDMLQSDRGPLILEVNSSPGLEGIEKATNFDIAGMLIEYVENHSHMRKVRKG